MGEGGWEGNFEGKMFLIHVSTRVHIKTRQTCNSFSLLLFQEDCLLFFALFYNSHYLNMTKYHYFDFWNNISWLDSSKRILINKQGNENHKDNVFIDEWRSYLFFERWCLYSSTILSVNLIKCTNDFKKLKRRKQPPQYN